MARHHERFYWMIKAIIFDFDGVILESSDIKTQAFQELFSDYPEKVREITDYHVFNAGISRYVKFQHIYEEILGKRFSREKELELGESFSRIVLQKILAAPFVPGADEFLRKYMHKYAFFVASGTPHDELCGIIQARKLQGYFKEVYGTPRSKPEIINYILDKNNFKKDEAIYIGDASSDKIAAQETGIAFIERRPTHGVKIEGDHKVIEDLSNLDIIIVSTERSYLKEDY